MNKHYDIILFSKFMFKMFKIIKKYYIKYEIKFMKENTK